MDPYSGKNPRDAAVRYGKQRALRTQMAQIMKHGIPEHAIYPGFGPKAGTPTDEPAAVPVPKRAIDRLAEKIVRGLTYLESGKLIGDSYTIEPQVLPEESAVELLEQFKRFGKRYERKPGLVVERCVAEDGISSMYRIEIWGQFRVYAFVASRSRDAVA